MAQPDQDPYSLALRALGRKERTVAEMAEWLRERGVEEAERADVVRRLAESGALDDGRFAHRYAEDKRELAGWGPERIREALRSRGVGEEEIEAALAAEGPEGTLGRAIGLLERSEADVGAERGRGRALALLARRGFPLELAYEAVRALERQRQ